jgi:hypothetical protein
VQREKKHASSWKFSMNVKGSEESPPMPRESLESREMFC